jgi:hypothetical protein
MLPLGDSQLSQLWYDRNVLARAATTRTHMEIIGRSPHTPTTGFEWLMLLAVLGGIAVSVSLASDRPSAALMIFAAVAFAYLDASITVPIGIALAGAVAFRFRGRTIHAFPGERALREGTILAGVLLLYAAGRNATQSAWSDARINSQAILDFERTLRIDPERTLQSWILGHDRLLQLANAAHGWLFLPFVAGTICWLYLTQDQLFRQYRTALAISAFFALIVVEFHPVATPGFMPGSGLIDTHVLLGGLPAGESELASVPSLHVGWVALSGAALFVGVRSRLRWFWLAVPVTAMAFVVMATGQHYVVDWIVGIAVAAGPFLAILWVDRRLGGPYYFSMSMLAPRRVGAYLNSVAREIADVPRLRVTVYSLGFLLTYLLARQAVDPGFTRYWGYMVTQITLTILIIVIFSEHFADEGGFSILTHAIVIVTTYADTLGTAAHMYDRFISYDKFTHFFGCAAVASAMGDLLINMSRKGTIDWAPSKLILVAVGLAIGAGMVWELYEFVGDHLLDTGRHNGRVDTTYDLISDTVGALVAAAFLYWWHFTDPAEVAPQRQPAVATQGTEDELTRLDIRQR